MPSDLQKSQTTNRWHHISNDFLTAAKKHRSETLKPWIFFKDRFNQLLSKLQISRYSSFGKKKLQVLHVLPSEFLGNFSFFPHHVIGYKFHFHIGSNLLTTRVSELTSGGQILTVDVFAEVHLGYSFDGGGGRFPPVKIHKTKRCFFVAC